jgi:hypothetical protein
MVKIAIPKPKIIEFIELRTGTSITLAELEIDRNDAFKNTSLMETDRLLFILKDSRRLYTSMKLRLTEQYTEQS